MTASGVPGSACITPVLVSTVISHLLWELHPPLPYLFISALSTAAVAQEAGHGGVP